MTKEKAIVAAINAASAHQFTLSIDAFYATLAASGYAVVPVEATAKHIKRGTTYDVLGEAHIQTDKPLSDMDRVVVYRCHETGHLWARRYAEFIDGRFEIAAAQKEQG